MAPQFFTSTTNLTASRLGVRLSAFDLPCYVKKHGFDGFEISDGELASLGSGDLKCLNESCRKAGCGIVLDINTDLTLLDAEARLKEIEHAHRMIAAAALIGAKTARISLGGQSLSIHKLFRRQRRASQGRRPRYRRSFPSRSKPFRRFKLSAKQVLSFIAHNVRRNLNSTLQDHEIKIQNAVKSLTQIVPVAAKQNVKLGIENHWGISGKPENILRILALVDSPYLGTCPDSGNFPKDIVPAEGIRLLAPYAHIAHAKSYGTRKDTPITDRNNYMLKVLDKFGFSGPVTIEYEGIGNGLACAEVTRKALMQAIPLPALR
jgi:sugar phosphate isomerase/epimerase